MSRVYLAGPITGLNYEGCTNWRTHVADVLREHGIQAISPMRTKVILKDLSVIGAKDEDYPRDPLITNKAITTRDRFDVGRADAILVNLRGAERISIGTMIELGWADALRKPIVLVMEPKNRHDHAMVREIAGIQVETLQEGVAAIISVCSHG